MPEFVFDVFQKFPRSSNRQLRTHGLPKEINLEIARLTWIKKCNECHEWKYLSFFAHGDKCEDCKWKYMTRKRSWQLFCQARTWAHPGNGMMNRITFWPYYSVKDDMDLSWEFAPFWLPSRLSDKAIKRHLNGWIQCYLNALLDWAKIHNFSYQVLDRRELTRVIYEKFFVRREHVITRIRYAQRFLP